MKHLYITLVIVLGLNISYSQWTYDVNYFNDAGNPGGINIETSDAPGPAGWSTIMPERQAFNSWSPTQSIPFNFDFFGSPVTHFKASQNGLLTFDTNATKLPNVNLNLPADTLPEKTICGFWDEFTVTPPTGSGDEIRTTIFGVAPNRQLWIKWYSFEMGNPVNSFNYFAIVLEESTNKIYIVDQYSNTIPLTATVGLQLNDSTAVQFGSNNITVNGNASVNTDNDYYEFIPRLLVQNNIAVNQLLTPTSPLVPGIQPVMVSIKNWGLNPIDTFDIQWEVNGLLQSSYHYTGDTILFDSVSDSLALGSFNFSNGFSSLKAWTENPNSLPDAYPQNDTLNISLCTGLSGVYQIGGATPDFLTLTEAADALNTCGVIGPVTLNIAPGLYNETIELHPLLGASSTNTVTFNGGASSLVTILADTNTTGNGVIEFKGADYVTIKNVTIKNINPIDAWGIHLMDTSNYITIDSCKFDMIVGVGLIDHSAIVASADEFDDFNEANNANFLTVSNCHIKGGEMGIHIEGLTTVGEWAKGIFIYNNVFDSVENYGVYMDNVDSTIISENTIKNLTNISGGDGIYLFDLLNYEISKNNINVPDYGIYVADGNFDAPGTSRIKVVNNMVISQTDYALYLDDHNNVDIFHNSLKGNPAIRINDFTGMDIRNNIFYSQNYYAFESDDAVTGTPNVVDYNLYYTPTSNALFVRDGATSHNDLAIWQATETTLNVNSIESNPFFFTPQDLHVAGPVANNMGDNTSGVITDIDGDTRPLSPSLTVDIGADEFRPLENDLRFIEFYGLATCGDSNYSVYGIVQSYGNDTVFNFNATVDVNSGSQTINHTFNDTLLFNQFDTILLGTVNTYIGGSFSFKGYVSLTGDSINYNDSAFTSKTLIPFEPISTNTNICGDSGFIYANTDYGSSYFFWDSLVGGSILDSGVSYFVPSVAAQDTFYLSYRYSSDTLNTTYAAGNNCTNGNMFDIISNSGNSIVQFNIHSNQIPGSNHTVNIYYINGSSYVGNETNPAAWTSAGTYNVSSNGGGVATPVILNTPIIIPTGTTAIYIDANVRYTNGSSSFTNASGDITVQTGIGLCAPFGSSNANRMFNGDIIFGTDACSSIRVPITATSIPLPPKPNLGNDTAICGDSLMLSANISVTDYSWSNGDSTLNTTIYSSGKYWVDVVDTNVNQCVNHDTINVIVNTLKVNLGNDTGYCVNDSLLLAPQIDSIMTPSVLWSTGDTTFTIYAKTPGTYYIDLSDSMCSASDTIIVIENSLPFINLGPDTALCAPNYAMVGPANMVTYNWSNGDTTQISYADTVKTYWLNIIDTNGCFNSDTVSVNVNPIQVSLPIDTGFCLNGDTLVTITAVTTNFYPINYNWSTGDTTASITVDSDSLGTYYLTINDSTSCFSIDSIMVINYPNEQPNWDEDTIACTGLLQLNVGSQYQSHLWNTGNTTSTLNAYVNGFYYVDLVDTNNCFYTDSITVILSPISLTMPNDTNLCSGDTIPLTANVISQNPVNYNWSNGDSINITSGYANTIFKLTVTDTLGCSKTDSVIINEILLTANFTTNTSDGVTYSFADASTNADSIKYLFGDGNSTMISFPTYSYQANGVYNACQVAYNECGSDTLCQTINVVSIGISENKNDLFELYPNPSDGLFTIKLNNLKAVTLNVYSVAGKLIHSQNIIKTVSQLDLTQQENGCYFVQLVSPKGSSIVRVIKQQ